VIRRAPGSGQAKKIGQLKGSVSGHTVGFIPAIVDCGLRHDVAVPYSHPVLSVSPPFACVLHAVDFRGGIYPYDACGKGAESALESIDRGHAALQ
jgi:hypothetical protein